MKVAFSEIIITPKNYIGVSMAGYTREDACRGKLDNICAHGVLIEESDNRNEKRYLLLLSLDTLKLPLSLVEYIKQKIVYNIPFLKEDLIIIHATHTHSSPDLTGEFYYPGGSIKFLSGVLFGVNRSDKYIVWFTQQIVKTIRDMFSNLQYCLISWTKERFNPNLVINRRHPSEKIHPELGIIAFRSKDSRDLIGILINYACHPTSLSYLNNKLSADYPGRILFRIKELTQDKIKGIYFNGPSGNYNPITTCGTNYEILERSKSLVYNQQGNYGHTKKIGYTLAEKALKLVDSIPIEEYLEICTISSHSRYFWIPLRDFRYYSKNWVANKIRFVLKKFFLLPLSKLIKTNFTKFVMKYKKLNLVAKSKVQVVQFKLSNPSRSESRNFDMILVPGELYGEYGRDLLSKSPSGSNNSFIFQNTNDWIGYLFPIEDYIEQGGWESFAGFSPVCGLYIINHLFKIFKKLK